MDYQVVWELIKFEIRDLAIRFSKDLAKKKREKIKVLENIIIDYESRSDLFSNVTEVEFMGAKNEMDSINEEKHGVTS